MITTGLCFLRGTQLSGFRLPWIQSSGAIPGCPFCGNILCLRAGWAAHNCSGTGIASGGRNTGFSAYLPPLLRRWYAFYWASKDQRNHLAPCNWSWRMWAANESCLLICKTKWKISLDGNRWHENEWNKNRATFHCFNSIIFKMQNAEYPVHPSMVLDRGVGPVLASACPRFAEVWYGHRCTLLHPVYEHFPNRLQNYCFIETAHEKIFSEPKLKKIV